MFEKRGNNFDFSVETEENRDFLRMILEKIDFSDYFHDNIFSPPSKIVEETLWLKAIEDSHSGAEGGDPNDLRIMDTYMAGIVRWTNAIGIKTEYSCDGHGQSAANLRISNPDQITVFSNCVNLISNGCWRYEGNRLQNSGDQGLRRPDYDRYRLLDVAEKFHSKMDALRDYVSQSKIMVNNLCQNLQRQPATNKRNK